jgi:hypothetical protein
MTEYGAFGVQTKNRNRYGTLAAFCLQNTISGWTWFTMTQAFQSVTSMRMFIIGIKQS